MSPIVEKGAMAVAGGVGAAFAGGMIAPAFSQNEYTPAALAAGFGALFLALSKRASEGKSGWIDESAGYGALAAAGVLAMGAWYLRQAKADLAANAAKASQSAPTAQSVQAQINAALAKLQQSGPSGQVAAGHVVGALRAADLQRMAPNSYLSIDQPAFEQRSLMVQDVPPAGTVVGAIPPGMVGATWASSQAYADARMRQQGLR